MSQIAISENEVLILSSKIEEYFKLPKRSVERNLLIIESIKILQIFNSKWTKKKLISYFLNHKPYQNEALSDQEEQFEFLKHIIHDNYKFLFSHSYKNSYIKYFGKKDWI